MNDQDYDFTVKAGGPDIKANVYPGKFLGVEVFDPEDDKGNKTSKYGPSRKWLFEAIDEDEVVAVNRLTSMAMTPGSNGYKMLTGIIGRQLEIDEQVSLRPYIDADVQLVIGPNKKGWMQVDAVLPVKKAK